MTLLYNTNSHVGLSICFIPLALGLTLVVTFLYSLLIFFLFSRANLFPMPPSRSHGDCPTTFDQLLSLSITKVFSFFSIFEFYEYLDNFSKYMFVDSLVVLDDKSCVLLDHLYAFVMSLICLRTVFIVIEMRRIIE